MGSPLFLSDLLTGHELIKIKSRKGRCMGKLNSAPLPTPRAVRDKD
jgi:hypothetical protein